jgi:hypothetical protein
MSRTKDLKTLPENNINLFKVLSTLVPEQKTKYTETLLRIIKKTPDIEKYSAEVKERLQHDLGIDKSVFDGLEKMELLLFYRMIDMFNMSDLKSFIKFCDLNERGLIKQNDLSKYNSFDEVMNSLSLAELVSDHKDLEKQIKIVHEDDTWLLLRPLTYHSSKKYGSNTKWCTTTENNPDYFLRYSKRGVLIYCINKETGYKVASFYSLDKNDPEFSFWDQKDSRVDSLDTELTDELRKIIYNESKSKGAKTNRFLLSDEERNKEEKLLRHFSIGLKEPIEPVMEEAPRTNYIRRATERAYDELVREVTEEEVDNHLITSTLSGMGENDIVFRDSSDNLRG